LIEQGFVGELRGEGVGHALTEHCGFANKIAVKFFPQFSSGTWRQVQNYRAVVHLSFDSERWLGCPTHASNWFKTSHMHLPL
jgi:hypothetical protein